MTGPTALNRARRATELAALADGQPVDVIVIGGGITGAGIALDAATRGLSVALVEKHDLAFGTSRWSSKLVHVDCATWPPATSGLLAAAPSNAES